MTVRATILGLVFALAIAAIGYANDWVFRLAYVASDLMPVSVFGLLLIGVLLCNPLLGLLRLRRLSGGEWATIFCLAFVVCVIPGPGLLWQFNNALIMPHHYQEMRPGWQAASDGSGLLSYVPDSMLVDIGGEVYSDAEVYSAGGVVGGFVVGAGKAGEIMPISRVPWRAWARPYALYIPLIVLGCIGTVCLSLIVHPQWAKREHLPYPVAQVAQVLIDGRTPGADRSIFRQSPFWIGFGIAAAVLVINGVHEHYPSFIQVTTAFNFLPVAQAWPDILHAPAWHFLLRPTFYFAVVGLAFLISAEVSFTVGISHLVYVLVTVVFVKLGVDVSNDYLSGGASSFRLFGAYLGAGLVILYAGRKYYWAATRAALARPGGDPVERHVVWACRLLIAASVGMVVLLRVSTGLDLVTGTVFMASIALLFLVVARINVETGVLFVQPHWQAVAVLLGLFGPVAMDPRTVIVLGILCVVLTADPRVCLMPLVVNGLKLGESQGLKLPRMGIWMLVALMLGLGVGVPLTLYVQYDVGGAQLYDWANTASRLPFEMLQRMIDSKAVNWSSTSPGAVAEYEGLGRLWRISPDSRFLWWCGLGLVAYVVCGAARLRWPRWPIHPVLFLVWGTLISQWFASSFFFGWLAKRIVVKYGTRETYRKAKILFIGMIAGEVAAGVIWTIVGAIYYAQQGMAGPLIRSHP